MLKKKKKKEVMILKDGKSSRLKQGITWEGKESTEACWGCVGRMESNRNETCTLVTAPPQEMDSDDTSNGKGVRGVPGAVKTNFKGGRVRGEARYSHKRAVREYFSIKKNSNPG